MHQPNIPISKVHLYILILNLICWVPSIIIHYHIDNISIEPYQHKCHTIVSKDTPYNDNKMVTYQDTTCYAFYYEMLGRYSVVHDIQEAKCLAFSNLFKCSLKYLFQLMALLINIGTTLWVRF